LDMSESYVLLSISQPLLVAPENHFYYTSPYLTYEEKTFICAESIEPEHIVCSSDCWRPPFDLAPHARARQEIDRHVTVAG
jgi:hypothetical protein